MVLADDRFIVIELVDVEIAKLLGEHVVKLLLGKRRRDQRRKSTDQATGGRKAAGLTVQDPTRTYEYGRFLSLGKPGMCIPPLFFAARGRRARTAAGGIRGRRARTAAGGIRGRRARTAAGGITAEAPCTLDA